MTGKFTTKSGDIIPHEKIPDFYLLVHKIKPYSTKKRPLSIPPYPKKQSSLDNYPINR